MKNIIICGAGEVGYYTAEVLNGKGHSVTVIDTSAAALNTIVEVIEARTIRGSSSHDSILHEANIENCDVLIAATSQEEINLLTAAIGKRMGAKKVIARIHSRNYNKSEHIDYAESFGVDHLICPEQLTSQSICAKLSDPGVIAIQRFAQNKIEMHQYEVEEDSAAIDNPLKGIEFPVGIRIALIRRLNKNVPVDAETVLMVGDVVSLIGPTKQFEKVKTMFHPTEAIMKKIVISGAGGITRWITNTLNPKKFSIRIFEPDAALAEEIATLHPHITVLNSSTLDAHVFNDEHIDECAAFLALSDSQEHNILCALQAKKHGIRNTFAIIHNSHFLDSIEGVGINYPFSPRIEAAKELLDLMDDSPVRVLAHFELAKTNVYELDVSEKSKSSGLKLTEQNFPQGTFIAAIERDGEVFAPNPHDYTNTGDRLIAIGPNKARKSLKKMFVG